MRKTSLFTVKTSTPQRNTRSKEKILFYSQRLKQKVVDMTDTCFAMLIATAAICYALGAAIGWHIKKSTVSEKKNTRRNQAKRKLSSVKKAGLR